MRKPMGQEMGSRLRGNDQANELHDTSQKAEAFDYSAATCIAIDCSMPLAVRLAPIALSSGIT